MKSVQCQRQNTGAHPMEDRLWCDDAHRGFAVADGVTAECYSHADDLEPTGPGICAQIFCDTFRGLLLSHGRECNEKLILQSFHEANRRIKIFNGKRLDGSLINFLDVDYCGTVGVAGYICNDGHLHYGHIGDCRVLVSNGDAIRLRTEDGVQPIRPYVGGLGLAPLERKVFVRSKLRNRRYLCHEGATAIGYGVLTGEEQALDFAGFGYLQLESGDQIIVFSDGVAPFLEQTSFRSHISPVAGKLPADCIARIEQAWKDQERLDKRFDDDKALITICWTAVPVTEVASDC